MFSLADALVFRPLQAPRATEIVALSGNDTSVTSSSGFGVNRSLSYLDYRDVRDCARSFEGLFAYRVVLTGFATRPGEPTQQLLGTGVSANFFRVLGVPPAVGRTFRDDEDEAPGRDPVVVLSHGTWTERFDSDPAIVGRIVRLGGRDLTVIGVAPASFTGMYLVLHPAFYVPLAMTDLLAGSPPGVQTREASGRCWSKAGSSRASRSNRRTTRPTSSPPSWNVRIRNQSRIRVPGAIGLPGTD